MKSSVKDGVMTVARIVPDPLYLRVGYFLRMGRPLRMNPPRTFNEKLQWLKLHDRNPLYTRLVDKYEMRGYVRERLGDEFLIPLAGGPWNSFDEIDFDALPERFVLKCTHDSGSVWVVRDRAAFAPPRPPAPARPSSAPARPLPASAHGRSGGRGLPTGAAGEGEDAPKAGAAKGDATAGLEVRSLRFAYGRSGKAAVDVEGLSFPRGAVVGVLGDNGAGKSTFARCVCGLERGCEGEVAVGGRLCSNARRRRLCYLVMQDVNHQLFTESVREEVALSLRNRPRDPLRGEAAAPVVDAILEGLDLESLAERHPMALSGGQKQRVAIASAVAGERAVCVFDEPTSGLDWAHMLDTARNLRDLSARGVTSLVITHDPELVAQCCDHALLMEQGRAAWWGRLDDPQTARRVEGFFG